MAEHQAHVDSEEAEETGSDQVDSTEKAQEFLKEHGSEIHPIFGIDRIDTQAMLVAPQFSESTQREVEKFLGSMENLAKDSSAKDYSIKFIDLRAEHSWDDMLQAAENAQKAYVAANPVRRAGRYVTAQADAAQPFLRLIPNDGVASVIYGALRLIFEAFSQLDERRMKIMKSFLRIPDIIILAEGCVKNYPRDEKLFSRAEAVLCSALPAIEESIKWIHEGSITKHIRAVVKGPTYNKDFKEKLQNLDESLNYLHERVTILRDQAMNEVKEAVQIVQTVSEATGTQMKALGNNLKSITETHEKTRVKVDEMHDLEQVKEQAREAIRIVLEQKIETSKWMREKNRAILRMERQIYEMQQAAVALTEEDVQDIMAANPSEDLRQVRRSWQSADMSQYELIASVITGEKLSVWLDSNRASALFIEGGPSGYGRNTTLSLLCMKLIDVHQDKEPAVPIYHFCGSHTSARDPQKGPVGIMRSLISQVLRKFSPKLDFFSRRYREQIEVLHLHTLCDFFCKLVRRLPFDAVLICIIDGISFFETREWVSGCREIMSHMQGLLEDEEISPLFKLLITSPVRSRLLGNAFQDIDKLTISEMSDDRRRPTEREMARASTRPIRPEKRPTKAYQPSPFNTESDWDMGEEVSEIDIDWKGS